MTAKSDKPASLGSVSLAAGSYDAQKLAQGLDAAVGKEGEAQSAAIGQALTDAIAGDGTASAAPATLPGHVAVDVQTRHGTERRQVFVPPSAADRDKSLAAAEPPDEDALEKANKGAVAAAISEARREGDVAPVPASEPAAGPAPSPPPPAPPPPASPAPAGDKQQ